MTSMIHGVSAYQQTSQPVRSADKLPRSDQPVDRGNSSSKAETKPWKPIDTTSPLVPQKTEYGFAIGNAQLSDKAKDYYDKLKSKFHNMDFILVSKDMMETVKKNASSYGNANKMVVLIDEEKLERMATDESFRKKYEGIISMAQQKLTEAKNSFESSGASVKNFGVRVDENGNMKFFATLEKASKHQKERIEKNLEEKREARAAEKKEAAKELREKRLEKAKEGEEDEDVKNAPIVREPEYVTIEADSFEALAEKVQAYAYENAASRVMTDAERAVGGNIDFRG